MAGPPKEVAPSFRKDRNSRAREGLWGVVIAILMRLSLYNLFRFRESASTGACAVADASHNETSYMITILALVSRLLGAPSRAMGMSGGVGVRSRLIRQNNILPKNFS